MGLKLNISKPSALLQKRERNGERADGPSPKRGACGRTAAAAVRRGSVSAAGKELWQRRVMLESQMGEPVRSKMMGTEGGRLGRAARCRSFSPRTVTAAEVCGCVQSGA